MAAHDDSLITLNQYKMLAERVKNAMDKKVGEIPEGYDNMMDYVDEVKDIAEDAVDSTEWKPIA